MKFKQALLHNTGWKMLAMLFTFLNNILIVRILGVEGSAVFFYAIAIFILLSTILKLGLENGIVYVLSKNPESTKSLTSFLLLFFIIQTFIAAVILKFFVKEIINFNFYWVLIYVATNILLHYVNALYQVKKMFKSLNLWSCLIVILQCIILTTFYFSNHNIFISFEIANTNIDGVFIISGAGILLQIILLIISFYASHANDFKVARCTDNCIEKLFSYSILNFIITVLFFLILRIDLYFVEKYCTKIGLANYLQAAKIGQMLLVFPGLIAGVIFPFTINDPEALTGKVAYLCRILTFLYLIIFTVFLLTGQFVFTWMLGDEFNLMYEIFAISFPGIYCISISLILLSYFEGINKQRIIIWSFLTSLLIIITANHLLVPIFGYTAACAIFSTANFVGMVILFKHFKKLTNIKFRELFIVKSGDYKVIS